MKEGSQYTKNISPARFLREMIANKAKIFHLGMRMKIGPTQRSV